MGAEAKVAAAAVESVMREAPLVGQLVVETRVASVEPQGARGSLDRAVELKAEAVMDEGVVDWVRAAAPKEVRMVRAVAAWVVEARAAALQDPATAMVVVTRETAKVAALPVVQLGVLEEVQARNRRRQWKRRLRGWRR
eukprot:2941338-Prymnesium_polylepis.1